jgi:hypothetical protein
MDLSALYFSPKREGVFLGKDWSPFRTGLEFSSESTGVLFGEDWEYLGRRLEGSDGKA